MEAKEDCRGGGGGDTPPELELSGGFIAGGRAKMEMWCYFHRSGIVERRRWCRCDTSSCNCRRRRRRRKRNGQAQTDPRWCVRYFLTCFWELILLLFVFSRSLKTKWGSFTQIEFLTLTPSPPRSQPSPPPPPRPHRLPPFVSSFLILLLLGLPAALCTLRLPGTINTKPPIQASNNAK